MKLTVIGCAGSFPGPDSPASCYLLEAPFEGRIYRILLDLGNGSFGALQRHIDPREIDAVLLSHLHADHCFDMSGLFVFSKYHPSGALPVIPVLAPDGAGPFLATVYGGDDGHAMTEQFDFQKWVDGASTTLGPFTVTASRVDHPVEAYGMRIECADGVLAYSGDSGPTDTLVELAADADLFLCEASFLESKTNPPNLHLTGAEAGDIAARAGASRLLVTHIPVWTDRAAVAADVSTTWSGAVELVGADETFEV